MARYLAECGLAPQFFGTVIKNPQDRLEAIRPIYEAVGGKLEQYYLAVGHSTAYVVAQIPDEVSLEALTMAVLASGVITYLKSVAVLTAAEAMEAMKKARSISYRPPS